VSEVERVRDTEVVEEPELVIIERVRVTETVLDGNNVRVAPVLDPVKDTTV